MAATNDPGYSTLEYVPNEYYNKKENPLPVYSGLQVVPVAEPGKEATYLTGNDGLEVNPNTHHDQPHQDAPRSRRKWLIIGGIVALIVIIAAVVGGVMASKGKSANREKDTNASSVTTSAPPTGTSSQTQSATPTSAVQRKRNIAAVSWSPTAGNQTRLYYQNNAGELTEAVVSDDKTQSSVVEADGKPGIPLVSDAKTDSALAAAVSRPGFPLTISVFYTDSNNLIHDVIYESRTRTWAPGIIASKGYITAANSSLAAMYNQCRFCANTTILAYQDANNFIQIANRTASGWQTTQILINQIDNTGMGLQPYYWAGMEDQLDLYYQRKDFKMAMASWKPSSVTGRTPVWAADQLWSEAPANAPIAAASSYHNVTSGTESWIQFLSVAEKGITVGTWDGAQRSWVLVANQHSSMSNTTTGKTFKSVAVTATGKAFAAVALNGKDTIESWQLADDYVNWASTGGVDIKTAWT